MVLGKIRVPRRLSFFRLVTDSSDEMERSVTEVLSSVNVRSSVSPLSGETSVTFVRESDNSLRSVSLPRGERSLTEVPSRDSHFSLLRTAKGERLVTCV